MKDIKKIALKISRLLMLLIKIISLRIFLKCNKLLQAQDFDWVVSFVDSDCFYYGN